MFNILCNWNSPTRPVEDRGGNHRVRGYPGEPDRSVPEYLLHVDREDGSGRATGIRGRFRQSGDALRPRSVVVGDRQPDYQRDQIYQRRVHPLRVSAQGGSGRVLCGGYRPGDSGGQTEHDFYPFHEIEFIHCGNGARTGHLPDDRRTAAWENMGRIETGRRFDIPV